MKSIKMTLIAQPVIVISFACLLWPVSMASSAANSDYHLKRKSCQITDDCVDPKKECVDGMCFCKPEYDDVLEASGNHDVKCLKAYDNTCNSTMRCNVYKFLECNLKKQICECTKHDVHHHEDIRLVYDGKLEKCVAFPDDVCDMKQFDGPGPGKVGCVHQAECLPDPNRKMYKGYYGICKCLDGFVKNSEGKRCIPEIGSKCEMDVDCDDIDSKGFICLEGECRCAADRIFDEKVNRCRLKIGLSCELERKNCVEGAVCVQVDGNDIEGRYHWGWKCVCDEGFHDDVVHSGTCVKDEHNEDDKCGKHKIFDKKRGKCSLQVGESCVTSGPNRCVSHAFCGTGNKCQCFESYQVTQKNSCEKGQNQDEIVTLAPSPASQRASCYNCSSVSSSITSKSSVIYLFPEILLLAYSLLIYIP